MTFGEQCRGIRELLGIDIQEMAELLEIPPAGLAALESSTDTFNRGEITRRFMRAVGITPSMYAASIHGAENVPAEDAADYVQWAAAEFFENRC